MGGGKIYMSFIKIVEDRWCFFWYWWLKLQKLLEVVVVVVVKVQLVLVVLLVVHFIFVIETFTATIVLDCGSSCQHVQPGGAHCEPSLSYVQ